MRLVFGSGSEISLTTMSDPSRCFRANAAQRAVRRALRGKRYAYERGCGPKTVAPPTQTGERVLPDRARPVPFWRQGFLPPPLTSARVFVEAVPARRLAICIFTTSKR